MKLLSLAALAFALPVHARPIVGEVTSLPAIDKNTYLDSGAPIVEEGERDKEGHYLRLW